MLVRRSVSSRWRSLLLALAAAALGGLVWCGSSFANETVQVCGSYGNNVSPLAPNLGPAEFTGQSPADKWGFALMGGAMARVPTGEGDKVWANVVYTQGAIAYTGLSQFGSFGTLSRFSGGSVGAAWALDGVFANTVGPAGAGLSASGIQLTRFPGYYKRDSADFGFSVDGPYIDTIDSRIIPDRASTMAAFISGDLERAES